MNNDPMNSDPMNSTARNAQNVPNPQNTNQPPFSTVAPNPAVSAPTPVQQTAPSTSQQPAQSTVQQPTSPQPANQRSNAPQSTQYQQQHQPQYPQPQAQTPQPQFQTQQTQNQQPHHHGTHQPRQPHLTFLGAVRGEFIKEFSLVSTWVLLIINTLLLPAGTAIMAWALVFFATRSANDDNAGQPAFINGALLWQSVTASVSMCMIVIAVFGVMSITTEYSTLSVQASLTANPRRAMFMNAKALVTVLLAFASSLIGLLLSWGIATALFAGLTTTPLADSQRALPIIALLGGAAVIAATALLSLGFGALFRSTVGGILTVIGLLMIVPSILSMTTLAGERMNWVYSVINCLPDSASSAFLAGPPSDTGLNAITGATGMSFGPTEGVFTPNWWQSGLILLAWALIVYIAGVIAVRRSDVK